MKRLLLCAVLSAAALVFAPLALARSAKAEGDKAAEALVQAKLVEPLAAKERDHGRFSRARLPPGERRVRILDEAPRRDGAGAAFFSFAVDERHGAGDWQLGALTGCAYVESGEVFVKRGDEVRPAAFLLGKRLKPAADTICRGG